jgi:hypothetical protein
LETFLEQQEHEHRPGQQALSGEIGRTAAMSRTETGLGERVTESFDERKRALWERNFVSHPHGTTTLYLLCTFKNITLSCRFNGSAVEP